MSIGTGTVSEDGTTITSDKGFGIVKGGWHCAGPPNPTGQCKPPSVELNRTSIDMNFNQKAAESIIATGAPVPGGNPAWHWNIKYLFARKTGNI